VASIQVYHHHKYNFYHFVSIPLLCNLYDRRWSLKKSIKINKYLRWFLSNVCIIIVYKIVTHFSNKHSFLDAPYNSSVPTIIARAPFQTIWADDFGGLIGEPIPYRGALPQLTPLRGKPPYTPRLRGKPLLGFAPHGDKALVSPSLLGFAPLFIKVEQNGLSLISQINTHFSSPHITRVCLL